LGAVNPLTCCLSPAFFRVTEVSSRPQEKNPAGKATSVERHCASSRRDRQLAEEWTYRFLAAAHDWARTEEAMPQRLSEPGGQA
jgi:hypothetical protein